MKNSKLLALLHAFNAFEHLQLQKFIRSPFHNQHQDVIKLYEYLRHTPAQDDAALQRTTVFHHLYPNTEFNDLKLRHISSYLMKVMEDFMVWNEANNDKAYQQIQLTRAYRKRKVEKLFSKTYNATQKLQQKSTVKDAEHHHNNYLLHLEQYHSTKTRVEGTRAVLQNLSDELDIYFIASKLKQACNVLSHRKVFKTDYRLGLLDEIIAYVEHNHLTHVPAIGIYYYTYLTLTREEESAFRNLKKLIAQHHQCFATDELRDVYLQAINFCIRQLNTGHQSYVQEVFELYKESLQNGAMLEQNKLSPFTYKNVVSAGLKLGEHQWIENFIHTYKSLVPEHHRTAFYQYNLAKLFFARGEYKQSTQALHQINIADLFTDLDARVILIKSYYELGELEYLEHLLDSFKQSLQRKEVLTYHKKNYSNFIRLTRKLINRKTQEGNTKLMKAINEAEILTERDWLLEKANKV